MVEAVQADLVPLGEHPVDDLRVLLGAVGEHEEGGPGATLGQLVQHPEGLLGVRTVVVGERDHLILAQHPHHRTERQQAHPAVAQQRVGGGWQRARTRGLVVPEVAFAHQDRSVAAGSCDGEG